MLRICLENSSLESTITPSNNIKGKLYAKINILN
jgi:hypothetical protein